MTVVVIFDEDLDNKTVKQVLTPDGKKVGAPSAEIEVLDAKPEGTDEYYIETSPKFLKHTHTNFIWQADIMIAKPRSEAVNEDLGTLSLEYQNKILYLRSDTELYKVNDPFMLSKIDNEQVSVPRIMQISKSYASTKAFNEAVAGTSYKFTTPKRYATSEGHPVVKETEFSVAYPELPYRDGELKLALGISFLNGNFDFVIQETGLPEFVNQALTSNEFRNMQVEVEYTIDKGDGNPVTGTATTTADQSGKNFLRDIGHELLILNQWTVTYKVKPFNFTWFEGNVTITSDAVTQRVGESI